MKKSIALFTAMTMLVPFGFSVNAEVTTEEIVELYDDFEGLDIGDNPENEYPEGNAVWFQYGKNTAIQKTEYGKSLRVTDNTNQNNTVSTRDMYSFFCAGDTVAEMDIKVSASVGRAMLFFGEAFSNKASDFKIAEFMGGNIYACGNRASGAEIGTYIPEKWYHVRADISFADKTFDVEISGDGTNIKREDLPWTSEMIECNLRLLVNGTSDSAYAYIDNIKIYRPAGVEVTTEMPTPAPFYTDTIAEGSPIKGRAPLIQGSSAFNRIKAVNYSQQLNAVRIEECYDDPELKQVGENIGAVSPGGYLRYDQIDFGEGAKGFYARVGSWHTGGNIEIRLDDLYAEPIGTLRVHSTGEWQNWETQSCEIDETKGIHDVYLVFIHAVEPIASLYWFTFSKDIPTEKYTYVPNPKTLDWDTERDTWVATDDLGRETPLNAEVGNKEEEKYVGLFYFPHLCDKVGSIENVTELEKENPEVDLKPGKKYYWAEPYFGYYLVTDEYIVRKHAQLLADAGVDFLFLDVSNGLIYENSYMKMFEIYDQIRREGGKTPQIMFFCNKNTSQGKRDVEYLWENLYSKELYKDLWFMLDGKPVINANMKLVDPGIAEHFTVRQSWAGSTGASWFGVGKDAWPWIDDYPQGYGWHESKDIPEQISVCVGHHATSFMGRSFHNGAQPEDPEPELGLNFEEQWSRALDVDPKIIFVTGWNEWMAVGQPVSAAGFSFLGRQLKQGQAYLVDQYNMEFSRDAEPMKGGFGDNYYYQLVQNIRRYKGASEIPKSSGSKTINIDGDFSQWDDVYPEYKDDKGDVVHRDSYGYTGKYRYIDETGRNDIDYTKVTYDKDYVYFYAHTQRALTEPVLKNWMTLYIDADSNHDTGWNGYDFAVNRTLKNDTTGLLEANLFGDWKWEKKGEVFFNVSGNEIQFAVNRTLLNLNGNDIRFDFKWCDNSVTDGDPMEFMDKGDAAPNERFNYRFITGGSSSDYVMTREDETRLAMDDALIIKVGSNIAYRNGVAEFCNKNDLSVAAFEDGTDVMVPARYIFEALGANVEWNPSGTDISYRDSVLTLTPNSDKAVLNGSEIVLKSAPRLVDDSLYIDVDEAAGLLFGYSVEKNAEGITIIYTGRRKALGDKLDMINALYDTECSLTALYSKQNAEEQELEDRAFALSVGADEADTDVSFIETDETAMTPVDVAPLNLKNGQLQPAAVFGSAYQNEQSEYHPPVDAVDGDSASSWRCPNAGFIVLDMGEIRSFDSLKMSFYNGDARKYNFDVHTSDDGETWNCAAYNIKSSGTTAGLEEFPLENASGRYIRIVGYGSNATSWNAYMEIEVYGK